MLPRRPCLPSNVRLLLGSARNSTSSSSPHPEKPIDSKWKELAKKQLKGKDPEVLFLNVPLGCFVADFLTFKIVKNL